MCNQDWLLAEYADFFLCYYFRMKKVKWKGKLRSWLSTKQSTSPWQFFVTFWLWKPSPCPREKQPHFYLFKHSSLLEFWRLFVCVFVCFCFPKQPNLESFDDKLNQNQHSDLKLLNLKKLQQFQQDIPEGKELVKLERDSTVFQFPA